MIFRRRKRPEGPPLTELRQDQLLFEELYTRYAAALFGIIERIVHSRELAEDLLQDTFVKVWLSMESYSPEKGTVFTWLLNIARNTAIDALRSERYRVAQKTDPLPESVYNDVRFSEEQHIDHIGLDSVLCKLAPELRQLIELAYYQGYTHTEIAQELGIPLGTVKTRLRSALQQLRQLLSDKS